MLHYKLQQVTVHVLHGMHSMLFLVFHAFVPGTKLRYILMKISQACPRKTNSHIPVPVSLTCAERRPQLAERARYQCAGSSACPEH